jgi:hypothetical protein
VNNNIKLFHGQIISLKVNNYTKFFHYHYKHYSLSCFTGCDTSDIGCLYLNNCCYSLCIRERKKIRNGPKTIKSSEIWDINTTSYSYNIYSIYYYSLSWVPRFTFTLYIRLLFFVVSAQVHLYSIYKVIILCRECLGSPLLYI